MPAVTIEGFLLASVAVATISVLGACDSGGNQVPASAAIVAMQARPFGIGAIRHVVVIVQENRSFDNLFAGFPGADAPMTGLTHDGRRVPLHEDRLTTQLDPPHYYRASIIDFDSGKMDGFSIVPDTNGFPLGLATYAYVKRSISAPYWTMAERYTLADKMFSTEHGSSWTAHLNVIGTTNFSPTEALVEFPSAPPFDCYAPPGTTTQLLNNYLQIGTGPFPCFDQFRTMADTLDAAGVSWRFYGAPFTGPVDSLGSQWSPFGAIRRVRYGSDWKNVIHVPPQILTDVAAGDLAGVTWVTPDWQYSDHAGGGAVAGPSWVAAIVNAIGNSKYWKDTAIVITWDEWGGWYDDAAPPQLDFKGLGLRVPCLIVSSYARPHHVSHTQYEFGSIQLFIEQTFNLPPLGSASAGYADARAHSIADSFNFAQKPLIFKTIPAPYPATYFLHLPPSLKPPDDY
ncbi:MAG: hypothetical protein JOY98_01705 [Candidatus Eremiobacteraeota bacterium]|nr:hypothetical protein [Candidatus Eremiobacteraeota bacterium]